MMKLNIGAGHKSKTMIGYRSVDINPALKPDICATAWDLKEVASNSVDEIYARHFIEHLTPEQLGITFMEWKRVLKKSGIIHLIFPNLAFHCRQIFMSGMSQHVPSATNFNHAMASIYGWINCTNANPFMEHKWGYTPTSFAQRAQELGFQPDFKECRACDIDVILRIR